MDDGGGTDHHHGLDGLSRVDDDDLARGQRLDLLSVHRTLVCEQRRDRRFLTRGEDQDRTRVRCLTVLLEEQARHWNSR